MSLEIELELVALFEEVAFVRKDRDYSVGDGRPRLNLLDPLEGVPETLGVSDVADDYECVLVSVELVQRALDVMTLGVELNRRLVLASSSTYKCRFDFVLSGREQQVLGDLLTDAAERVVL